MLISTTPAHSPNYGEEIRETVTLYDQPVRVGVSSPYVTPNGLQKFSSDSSGNNWTEICESQWVVGINQGITSPDVLRELHSNPNATVRVFLPRERITDEALRRDPYLHAKVTGIGSRSNQNQQSLIISSANITDSAMGEAPRNYELGIHQSYPDSLSKDDIQEFRAWWKKIWSQSVQVDEDLIGSYEEVRNEISKEVLEEQKENGGVRDDATEAKYMWTDTGAMQGEKRYLLEIKEELAEFFDEKCNGVEEIKIEHNGRMYDRKIKFDEGHYSPQWRVYLPTAFSGHDEGYYRYKSAFFEKKKDENGNRYYRLEVRGMDHSDVDMWMKKSAESGTQKETDAGRNSRRYGYW